MELNETYRYYAAAYNADGQASAASNIVTVSVTDVTFPEPPTISGTVSGDPATLTWEFTAEYDLQGYHVYRGTSPGGPYVKRTTGGPVRATSFDAQLIDPETTYYFVVQTVDWAGNESGPSNEVALIAE